MTKPQGSHDVSIERIESAILLIRGHKVMLDRDLAALYGVTTFNLNKAVKHGSLSRGLYVPTNGCGS